MNVVIFIAYVNSYVHSQILKTLLEMMRVDNFDSITISRLTAKAEVGRASFYRNYQTKEDVLRQEAERLNLDYRMAQTWHERKQC